MMPPGDTETRLRDGIATVGASHDRPTCTPWRSSMPVTWCTMTQWEHSSMSCSTDAEKLVPKIRALCLMGALSESRARRINLTTIRSLTP